MKRLLILLLLVAVLLAVGIVWASPDSLTVSWWTVDGGGTVPDVSGGPYTLHGTAGQADAGMVSNGRCAYGIMIDGAGIGSCMAANKVPGVRAAMCYDQATAVNSKEHNNANVLTLGAGLIGPNLAQQIVTTWLNTDFAGGRHTRRVDKIDNIGKRFK